MHGNAIFCMKERIFPRLTSLLLIAVMTLGMIPGILLMPQQAFALPDAPHSLFNYPSQYNDWQPGDSVTMALSDLDMDVPSSLIGRFYDNEKYVSWPNVWAYTPESSKKYNGYSTPDHVVFDNDTVRFLGYGVDPALDMVFYEDYVGGFDSLSFTLQPIVMNFHTFSESGVLFNGAFTGQYYTGYALILKNGNLHGMINSGESSISLIYIDNEKFDGTSYSPGILTSTRTLIGTYKTGIRTLTTQPFDIRIDKRVGGEFTLYLDGQPVQDVANPRSASDGFGFFTGHYRHACRILTVMEFSQIAVTRGGGFEPIETGATIRFVDYHSVTDFNDPFDGDNIANPQNIAYPISETGNPQNSVSSSFAGDHFKVVAPPFIDGYAFKRASRSSLDPVKYRIDPDSNVIVLYYAIDPQVRKSALVDNVEGIGTADEPLPVPLGSEFDYQIDIVNPGAGRTLENDGILDYGETVTQIVGGFGHSLALTSAGNVYAWGFNEFGQLGDGTKTDRPAPVKVLAGAIPSTETVIQIAVGYPHNLVLTDAGNLYAWGRGINGQLGNGFWVDIDTPVKVLAGEIPSTETVTQIRTGTDSSYALTDAGNVYAWGNNNDGRLGDGNVSQKNTPGAVLAGEIPSTETVIQLDTGTAHSLVLTDAGNLYAWGANYSGQLGNGTGGPGTHRLIPTKVLAGAIPSTETVTQIKASATHSLVLTDAGNLYSWGGNGFGGQLGDGTLTSKFAPIKVLAGAIPSTETVTQIMTGMYHNFVLSDTGKVYGWGFNEYAQLGDGTKTSRTLPIWISRLRGPELFSVVDLIPEGLSLVKNGTDPVYSITDENGDAIDIGLYNDPLIEVVDGQEEITLFFGKLPHGTTRFTFRVSVDVAGIYVNKATFYDATNGETLATNETHHATGVAVTEKYQAWGSGNKLKDDTFRGFGPAFDDDSGDPYSPYPFQLRPIMDGNGDMWRLVGYQRIGVDASPVLGHPPMGMQYDADDDVWIGDGWCYDAVDGDEEIIFFFAKDIKLTIDYKDNNDRTGVNIKSRTTLNVNGMRDYYLPTLYMNDFDNWKYASAYSLDGGTTIIEGVPPLPTFVASVMTGDKHIVLYFTQDPVVTVQYREYNSDETRRLNSQMLFNVNGTNKETFVLEGDSPYTFDPNTKSSITNTLSDGATSITGHEYKVFIGWSIDGGITVNTEDPLPVFSDIDISVDIILYFSTQYIVIEKFQANDRTHSSDATTLRPDVLTEILGGEPFNGNAPRPTFNAGGKLWEYIGWVMDKQTPEFEGVDPSDYHTLVDGVIPPSIAEINASGITIIYIYHEIDESNKITITERFREYGNINHRLDEDIETDIEIGENFGGNWPSEIDKDNVKYYYWGYRINNEPPINAPFPGFEELEEGSMVTYLYTTEAPPIIPTGIAVDSVNASFLSLVALCAMAIASIAAFRGPKLIHSASMGLNEITPDEAYEVEMFNQFVKKIDAPGEEIDWGGGQR